MRVWAAVILSVIVAGCGAKSPEPDPQVPGMTQPIVSSVLPWGMEECRFAVALVGVDPVEIAYRLPPGFRSLSLQEIAPSPVPLPPGPGQANFGVEMGQCKGGTGLRGELVDVVYGSYFTAVEPPEGLRNDSHPFHFVKWEVIDQDVERRAILIEAGVPAFEGTTTFPDWDRRTDAFDVHGSMVLGSWGPHFIDGVFAAPFDAPTSFDEFTVGDDGFVVWTTEIDADIRAGSGFLKVPPNSFAGSVLGGSEVAFAGFAGSVSFRNASIQLPTAGDESMIGHGH